MVKDKFLLTAVVSVGTLHSGDRHQARFHGQHLGLCRLILVGHGDDFTGSIFLHGHHGTSLNIRGIARRDDLRRTALIGGCDLHSREIQQLTRGIDPLVRLLRHSDGLHRIRYRLDRDLLADAVRRNRDDVFAHRQAGLIHLKVGNSCLLAGGINVHHRQSIFDILLRGGIIEGHAILHANIQRGRLNDGEFFAVAIAHTGDFVAGASSRELKRGQIACGQIGRGLKCNISKRTAGLNNIFECVVIDNRDTGFAGPCHFYRVRSIRLIGDNDRQSIYHISRRHLCVVVFHKQVKSLNRVLKYGRVIGKIDLHYKRRVCCNGRCFLAALFKRCFCRKVNRFAIGAILDHFCARRYAHKAHQHCQCQKQGQCFCRSFSHSAPP